MQKFFSKQSFINKNHISKLKFKYEIFSRIVKLIKIVGKIYTIKVVPDRGYPPTKINGASLLDLR